MLPHSDAPRDNERFVAQHTLTNILISRYFLSCFLRISARLPGELHLSLCPGPCSPPKLGPVHVLSVSSLKGGVGKTTITLGLASAAFSRGLRTLVVDLDPQSDASTGLDVDPEGFADISDVLEDPREKVVRSAIAPSGWNQHHDGSIDLLIGSPTAINFDGPHPTVRDIWKLEEALSAIEHDYDLVLLDCAPSLNALTRTAWAASDRVLIVAEPGLFAVSAADRALRAIEEIRRGVSPRLHPLGIVINRIRPQSMEHQFRIRELKEMFGALVLHPHLPERTSLQQAQGAAKPVHMWPGEHAQEMAGFFDQLLDQAIRSFDDPAIEKASQTAPVASTAASGEETTVAFSEVSTSGVTIVTEGES